jgi:hypothetical protein
MMDNPATLALFCPGTLPRAVRGTPDSAPVPPLETLKALPDPLSGAAARRLKLH